MAGRIGRLPIWCPVCGRPSVAVGFPQDPGQFRDAGPCVRCGAVNRHRQLALALIGAAAPGARRWRPSLRTVRESGLRVYSAESNGPLHEHLRGAAAYCSSEYLGPDVVPGSVVDGVRHEDLMELSFADGSFDIVLTGDVLEHVSHPYRAHEEVLRVLRPGGRHIFTVPFHHLGFRDERLTEVGPDGRIEHLVPPTYHDDPVRAGEGALVHTVFGLEMLAKLRDLGFVPVMAQLYAPHHGILGDNAFVFEAVKVPWGWA